MKRILLFLLILCAAEPGAAASRKLPPRDECARDASLTAFRQKLLTAVDRKDAKQLLSLTADDIRFSFGEGGGKRGVCPAMGAGPTRHEQAVAGARTRSAPRLRARERRCSAAVSFRALSGGSGCVRPCRCRDAARAGP